VGGQGGDVVSTVVTVIVLGMARDVDTFGPLLSVSKRMGIR